jgi:hypothetical protein
LRLPQWRFTRRHLVAPQRGGTSHLKKEVAAKIKSPRLESSAVQGFTISRYFFGLLGFLVVRCSVEDFSIESGAVLHLN